MIRLYISFYVFQAQNFDYAMYNSCNSTFGNLESTTDWLEVVFIIIVLTTGLLLVTMLIGNIKVSMNVELWMS